MKKIVLITLLFLFNIAFGQNYETQKLESLCKVWGFLKYYHPEVADGKYNWDEELLKMLPKVQKAVDNDELSKIYKDWIVSLGNVEPCRRCSRDSRVELFENNFDLSWTQNDKYFNSSVSNLLNYIEQNRFQGKHYFVNQKPVGIVEPVNEPDYENFIFPTEPYRLLALFKYWNFIEYFYPYKYMTDQKWGDVLPEMIHKFQTVSNEEEYHKAIQELIAKLDDSHAWIRFTDESRKYLPAKIKIIENKAVISGFFNDSLADLNNLKMGDLILSVNDIDLAEEVISKRKYISGSNSMSKGKTTFQNLLTGMDSIINVTLLRGDTLIEQQVKRYDFRDFNYYNNSNGIHSASINKSVGYINMRFLKGENISETFDKFKDKKAIIIDLRNYPEFIYRLISRQINSEKRTFARIHKPYLMYPGKFYIEKLETGVRNRNPYKGHIVLLVDDETFSRAEFTAMAFQTADNVTTIGNQTVGADGDVTVFDFFGGYKTAMTGIGIYYPDGTASQRRGVKIDIEVKPTIQGIREGRDEVLEKALEYIINN